MQFVHRTQDHETIAALATPPGVGGIAIVRVSGGQALAAVGKLVRRDLHQQLSHSIKVTKVYGPSGDLLDTAILLVMRGPKSFTGEDVVEIQCHGGHIVAKKVMEALVAVGVRPAGPGEFSLRAFLHGKMDLSQAEALQDLIGAQNETALRVAQEQLEGKLSERIKSLQQRATELAALFEAWVDFPEDDLGFCSFDDAARDLQKLQKDIVKLVSSFAEGRMISSGISLCILGAPNVGKSSLMNALLGKDRAIVSHIAGTTRDLVEDFVCIRGLHYRLTDTAGIRESSEAIESEGIRRSKAAMEQADVILGILDASRPDDRDMLAPAKDLPREKSIFVWNKVDISDSQSLPYVERQTVAVSSKTGQGLEELLDAIDSLVWRQKSLQQDEVIITRVRHKEALEQAAQALQRAIDGLAANVSAEFVAMEMRDVLRAFGTIVGTNITHDVLNVIFSQFCIGK